MPTHAMERNKEGRHKWTRMRNWEDAWMEWARQRKSFYNRLETKSRIVPIGILYIIRQPCCSVCFCLCVCTGKDKLLVSDVLDIGYLREKCYILMSFVWDVPLMPKLEIRHKEVVDANGRRSARERGSVWEGGISHSSHPFNKLITTDKQT